jgi:hypothetical protein
MEWSCNSLKYSPDDDLCFSWTITQKKGHMLQPLGGQAFKLTSNVLGKGVALSCLHQLPSTITGENPTKT